MKEKILLAIAQFEDIFSEWEDYKIKLVDEENISISYGEEKYSPSEAKELLTDFRGVLKKNNLMFSSKSGKKIKIEPYIYTFEVEYEEIADSIERVLGNRISNLSIYTNKQGNPIVKFTYAENLTSGEKNKVKKTVDDIVSKNL
jgi:hypothetical protein